MLIHYLKSLSKIWDLRASRRLTLQNGLNNTWVTLFIRTDLLLNYSCPRLPVNVEASSIVSYCLLPCVVGDGVPLNLVFRASLGSRSRHQCETRPITLRSPTSALSSVSVCQRHANRFLYLKGLLEWRLILSNRNGCNSL